MSQVGAQYLKRTDLTRFPFLKKVNTHAAGGVKWDKYKIKI